MAGNIVVDGVLASCYASTYHDLGHIGMMPLQLFPGITQWIFGEDYGFHVYANIAEMLGNMISP